LNSVATPQLLERFKKCSTHIDFSFPEQTGSGFAHMLKHVSREAVDLIHKLLIYDPEERCVLAAARAVCVCLSLSVLSSIASSVPVLLVRRPCRSLLYAPCVCVCVRVCACVCV
jgi:hypothetical protein